VHASDPATICRSPVEAMALAARYRRIITDRLHCAIAGLHAGREVTLLPNNTHKNRSMHETWLAAFGCRFAVSRDAATAGQPAFQAA
jgi:exopolysaccharide biosynthesis predicted pyruvyltransferase EpsI